MAALVRLWEKFDYGGEIDMWGIVVEGAKVLTFITCINAFSDYHTNGVYNC